MSFDMDREGELERLLARRQEFLDRVYVEFDSKFFKRFRKRQHAVLNRAVREAIIGPDGRSQMDLSTDYQGYPPSVCDRLDEIHREVFGEDQLNAT